MTPGVILDLYGCMRTKGLFLMERLVTWDGQVTFRGTCTRIIVESLTLGKRSEWVVNRQIYNAVYTVRF